LFLVEFIIHHIEIAVQSIHAQENEHVVVAAMRTDEARCFRLAPRVDVLPQWSRRGLVDEMEGDAGEFLFEQASTDDHSVDKAILIASQRIILVRRC
jgi:putative methyltransferase